MRMITPDNGYQAQKMEWLSHTPFFSDERPLVRTNALMQTYPAGEKHD
ncbi:hypothetical protein ACOMICROBIO_EPCKBFOG_01013 [Vibrio sp. B1FLJ16]|nr:hypothetical protein ACOMICROBIO_FLGHMIGD_00992 [Vibrio sp. B1FLJ16]CAD7802878.1 hypothetical protein ACOMICROBIO_EPCKBFOG_01013 [Vibrio sp. B1FLJ16]CAE6893256.1 hypothetical protein ACOMICROBIO_FLGHMIGD_00992 [Vibrio sp. B1FLJ16]CAE6894565.1 hypothetical protein ACOMICROBIO_EPCKBFOG_01013 [Vibrio sp. B1FLJ16]